MMDQLVVRWGANVIAARRTHGWTQQELADRTGLTQQTISRIERGDVAPSDATRIALGAAFALPPEILFPYLVPVPA